MQEHEILMDRDKGRKREKKKNERNREGRLKCERDSKNSERKKIQRD